mgnify:CR=1 FL=1
MTHKQLSFRSAAREKVLRGATQLAEAVRQCVDDDPLRRPDVQAALSCLEQGGVDAECLADFRRALRTPLLTIRPIAARAAYAVLVASRGRY